jgi:hypothetical protein
MPEHLSPDERAAVVKLLRETIAADQRPLNPRIRMLESALARLNPPASAPTVPIPPPKVWINSNIGRKRRR